MVLLCNKFLSYPHTCIRINLHRIPIPAEGRPSHTLHVIPNALQQLLLSPCLRLLSRPPPLAPHLPLLLLPLSMWYPSALLFRRMLLLRRARHSGPDMDLSRYQSNTASLLHWRHRKRKSSHRRSQSRLPIWGMPHLLRNITRRRSRPANIARRRLSLAVVIGIAGLIFGALHAW